MTLKEGGVRSIRVSLHGRRTGENPGEKDARFFELVLLEGDRSIDRRRRLEERDDARRYQSSR